MKKFKKFIIRFAKDSLTATLVTILCLVFGGKALLKRLVFRKSTAYSDSNIKRIETLIEHDLRNMKGFYLYVFVIQQLAKGHRAFHEGDICAFITIAALELNLSKSEKLYLCMKYNDYAPYITAKFRR